MQKKHLIMLLNQIPDSAEIYVSSEHGEKPDRVGYVSGVIDVDILPFYGDDLKWKYLTDMTAEELKQVKAILIH